MKWEMKLKKNKPVSEYKTLYISENLIYKINNIAKEKDTSFNSVVISMIEACLGDESK